MTHIDLFSGIGGFALAAYWAGFSTEVFCEKERFCQDVLQRHWPNTPIVRDIREFPDPCSLSDEVCFSPCCEEDLCELKNNSRPACGTSKLQMKKNYKEGSQFYANVAGKSSRFRQASLLDENNTVLGNAESKLCEVVTAQILEVDHGCKGNQTQIIRTEKDMKGPCDIKRRKLINGEEGCTQEMIIPANTAGINQKGKINLTPTISCIGQKTSHCDLKFPMESPYADRAIKNCTKRRERIDLITAGVPCQPASCAGKRRGENDDRWLWPETLNIIFAYRPKWVVLENVYGLVTLQHGLAFEHILSDLEDEGYEVGTMVIPACAVNAPHIRKRVWIVAHHESQPNGEYHGEPRKQQIQQSGIRHAQGDVANPHSARLEGRDVEELRERSDESPVGPTGPSISNTNSPPKNRPAIARRQCRRGQLEPGLGGMAHGLPGRMDGHFDEEPNIPRIATGIPDRAARLRALGNSIVPQVAYQIISNISKLEKSP